MQTIAEAFFMQQTTAVTRTNVVAEISVSESLHRSSFSIFEAEGRGFVVVSSSDDVEPVIGYSSGSYKEESLPCGFRWWLDSMDEALQLRKHAPRRAEGAQTYIPVENFLPARWGQDDPFNALCPKIENKLPPSGCVATAMAQLLYFYRYPAQGKGKGWYTIGSSASRMNQTISSTYEWTLMRDDYKMARLSDEERNAIATLLRDAGYGCRMNYTLQGSGALSSSCAASFVDNFSYDPLSIRCYHRDFFTTEEWMSTIQNELLAGRPIFYGGSDKSHGGHAFVFSGIKENGLVYVNWGWNGDADGYYDIRSLNPTGILGTSYIYAFTEGQMMVCGLKAQPHADAGEFFETHIVMNEPFTAKSFGNNYLQLNTDIIYNLGYRDFRGEVGYYIVSDDNDTSKDLFSSVYDNSTGDILAAGNGTHITGKLLSISNLPSGSYHIYMGAQPVDSEQIDKMRAPGGLYSIPLSKNSDGTISIGEGGILDGITPTQHTLTSTDDGMTRVYDTSGRIIYAAPTTRFNLWDVPARGILVIKQGNNVRKVVR